MSVSASPKVTPNRRTHWPEIAGNGFPDDRHADAEVLVNEQIPKVAHVLPRDISKPNGSHGVHVTRRLADDLKVSQDGIDGHSVGGEGFERVRGSVIKDPVDGFGDIPKA
jgi:hypothetical protein